MATNDDYDEMTEMEQYFQHVIAEKDNHIADLEATLRQIQVIANTLIGWLETRGVTARIAGQSPGREAGNPATSW